MTHPPPPTTSDLAELAHELRTPLTAIIGYADAMRDQALGPLIPVYVQAADTVLTAARHLLALVDALSPDRTRLEFERFDVRALVAATVDLFRLGAQKAGHHLSLDQPDEPVTVLADREAVIRILVNLIGNAVKFASPGQPISILVDPRRDELRLSVFNGFENASALTGRPPYRGPGRGLKIVRALCEAHDGVMELYDDEAGGVLALANLRVVVGG